MLNKARAIKEQIVAWRREFHQHPELGFQENRTAARLAEVCTELGWRVRTGVGRTGVVADLGSGSPMVAVRADMDALPLQEANQCAYRSRIDGVMHACGHDSHLACALGVARLLKEETFPGSVRLIFQPSEEVADEEGISGAPRMIDDGALEGVDLILALHVDPGTPSGIVRIDSGPASGGVDSWFAEVRGKGGHGAHPHETVDPFYLSAHVIMALNAIVSRRLDPTLPAVVSIGSLHGGQAENVIPDAVRMTGTLRYTEKSIQEAIHSELRRSFETVRSLGGDYELRFELGTPPMLNHPLAAGLIREAAVPLIGEANVLSWKVELGAEDFGSFLDRVPGAMFALGTSDGKHDWHLHSPDFDLDEEALPVGVAVMTAAILKYLRKS